MTIRAPLLGVSLGYFMVLLDASVLAVAEPDLAASLGATVAGLQWATTAYLVVFGALLLSGGAVADRVGAQRAFRWSVGAFGAVSLLCAVAPTLLFLVGLRAVLGAAAAGCVPSSLALVARLYPEPARRARAIATWAAISGSAVAAGPVIGGLLVAFAGWRAIFVVNVPIAVLVLVLAVGPALAGPRGDRRIDWPAQLVACVTLALATDALIAAGSRQWEHAIGAGAGAVVAGVGFALLNRRSDHPALDPALLGAARLRAGLVAGAAVNLVISGTLFVLPLLLTEGLGLGPVATGLAFLPLTLPFVLNPPLTGRLVARYGARLPVLLGLALLAVGAGVLGIVVPAGGYPLVAVGLLVTGFGVSFALPALVAAVVGAAPQAGAGAAGGLLNAVRQIGATVGVAAMGAVVGPGAFWLAAAVAVLAACWFAAGTATTREQRAGRPARRSSPVPPRG